MDGFFYIFFLWIVWVRKMDVSHFKFVPFFHISSEYLIDGNFPKKPVDFQLELKLFPTLDQKKTTIASYCNYIINQSSRTVYPWTFFVSCSQFRFSNMFKLLRFIFDWGHGQCSSHIYLRYTDLSFGKSLGTINGNFLVWRDWDKSAEMTQKGYYRHTHIWKITHLNNV